jgi:Holliday junction resolvase
MQRFFVWLVAPSGTTIINLNVKIEHEITIKVDKERVQIIQQNPAIF